MKTATALALAAAGVAVAFRFLPREFRDRVSSFAGYPMLKGFEHMMAGLPEGAPPKLVMSILPRLQAQNDQIIAMLREQNELLREQQHVAR